MSDPSKPPRNAKASRLLHAGPFLFELIRQSFNFAPAPGLEPGTISLHVTPMFPLGVDYIITLYAGARRFRRHLPEYSLAG